MVLRFLLEKNGGPGEWCVFCSDEVGVNQVIQVASYCRVSTDKDDQANSFEAQQRYFKEYIERQADWELYDVYADEGITGTSTKKRAAFHRMIHDAHMGRFRLILTKEVSRFSRNILDTIAYTRELRQLGVGVLFMNDGINTLDPDAELRLSIMGSIAQEESRKTSTRVKWGQTRQMERGVVFGTSLLGYDVKDGKISINLEGAELVKLIFQKYGIEKKGTTVIAREMREAGFRTYRGNPKWSNSHIIKILKNEKYVGDLVQKKTYTPDYLTHAKKYNRGEEALVVIQNHHPPIIDRELWDTVQAELKNRNVHGEPGSGHSNRYVFSGKIKCGECGGNFVSRKKYNKNGTFCRRWSCRTATNEGRRHVDAQGNKVGCDVGRLLRDDVAMDILKKALCSLSMDTGWLIRNVTDLVLGAIGSDTQKTESQVEVLEREISQIREKKEDVLDAFFSKYITKDEMQAMNQRYDHQLASLKERMVTAQVREGERCTVQLQEKIQDQIADMVFCKTDSDTFYKNMLDFITVHQDGRVEVRIHCLPQKWIFQLTDTCGKRL